MQITSYAPLIEFHGYRHSEFLRLKDKLMEALKEVFLEEEYANLTFSEIASKVIDTKQKVRPFLRMFSSEYFIVHKVVDILKKLNWDTEVEFIKITNYFDLRKEKNA